MQQQVVAAPVWLWRMRHPTVPLEWGMRVERPLMKDGDALYVSVTLNGQVHRTGEGWLCVSRAARLEPLLAFGELWRKELRAHGWHEVEDDV